MNVKFCVARKDAEYFTELNAFVRTFVPAVAGCAVILYEWLLILY